jgi:hypothetical protein
MSELELCKWKKAKDAKFVNSVPAGTMVFIYKKGYNSTTDTTEYGQNDEVDVSNEFFIKR